MFICWLDGLCWSVSRNFLGREVYLLLNVREKVWVHLTGMIFRTRSSMYVTSQKINNSFLTHRSNTYFETNIYNHFTQYSRNPYLEKNALIIEHVYHPNTSPFQFFKLPEHVWREKGEGKGVEKTPMSWTFHFVENQAAKRISCIMVSKSKHPWPVKATNQPINH